ncbi:MULTISPECIES: polysaccharide biosynthesis protein [Olivibacter]|uniref:Polysaccharide biosynthesis protein n=1 Tax=Olivibacter jilunii TaxID=985016 RepID=A0ABW6B9T5_9SPHI|nr:polysaccharide biosynthesis protein [Olivibacter sp. UJ_SKK_5.1]MDX3912667.1 nucleoside-diphosphate sugar epimerase/dehydratase [Pseudosphingobacterium sp.]
MSKNINIVPRWIIFLLDLGCSAIALLAAYLIKHDFNFYNLTPGLVEKGLPIYIAINGIIFFIFKLHAGIIRYTSSQDSVRILGAIMVSHTLVYAINLIGEYSGYERFITAATLAIASLVNFVLLIVYRGLVKYFFMYIKNLNLKKSRTLIFGAGEIAIAAKRAFDHNRYVNKDIVGFIEDNRKLAGKVIDGVRIYHSGELRHFIKSGRIDEIIFSTHNIEVEKRTQIVDLCLECGVKVLTLPPLRQLINGEIKPIQIKKLNIEDLLERKPIEIDLQLIANEITGKRLLITGAAGSIGSEIVHQLSNFSPEMIILCDQAESPLHDLYLELKDRYTNLSFHPFIGDVRNERRMSLLFEMFKPHFVYHAAAYKHVPMMENNPLEAVHTNVWGTKVIADLAVAHGVEKFVMVSTDKAVNPTNVMGASKRIAEIYVQSLFHHLLDQRKANPTRFITTRFGNVLGSNGSVIPRFRAQIEHGGPITVTHPEITRYFMTIPEACRLVLEAGAMGNGGEIYVFDMGQSVKIVDLAKKMIRLSGLTPEKDIQIIYSGLRPGEKLYEELLNDQENTLPTHHEKVMIAKVRLYNFQDVSKQINDLIASLAQQNDHAVVLKMKQIVPEFKSKNSIYEELDRPLLVNGVEK